MVNSYKNWHPKDLQHVIERSEEFMLALCPHPIDTWEVDAMLQDVYLAYQALLKSGSVSQIKSARDHVSSYVILYGQKATQDKPCTIDRLEWLLRKKADPDKRDKL